MKTLPSLFGLLFVCAVTRADEGVKPIAALTPLVEHVLNHPDGQAVNSIDFAALKGDRSQLPIGVFDSGIGGLTVLEAILKLDAFNNSTLQPGADGVPDFAGEKFLYLGDQANMPYGNYPSKGKEDFLRELIVKDAVFLLGKRYYGADGPRFDKPPVKAIVIACNTATAYGIEDIREALKTWGLDVPVIGVVEAGARAVVEMLPNEGSSEKGHDGAASLVAANKAPHVAILATVGTCSSNAYPKAINRMAGLAGKPLPHVLQQGSVGMAGAIEGNPSFVWRESGERPVAYGGPVPGLNSVQAYTKYDIGQLLATLNRTWGGTSGSLDMLVLGCTHFPLAEKELGRELEKAIKEHRLSGKVPRFINPAEYTAKDLFRELARARLRNKADAAEPAAPSANFFLSVAHRSWAGVKLGGDGSLETAYKEGREPGHVEREDTKVIRMTPETLPPSSRTLVTKLPAVWERLRLGAAK